MSVSGFALPHTQLDRVRMSAGSQTEVLLTRAQTLACASCSTPHSSREVCIELPCADSRGKAMLWLQRLGNSAAEEPPYRAASSGDESEDNDSVLDDWQPQVSTSQHTAARALGVGVDGT